MQRCIFKIGDIMKPFHEWVADQVDSIEDGSVISSPTPTKTPISATADKDLAITQVCTACHNMHSGTGNICKDCCNAWKLAPTNKSCKLCGGGGPLTATYGGYICGICTGIATPGLIGHPSLANNIIKSSITPVTQDMRTIIHDNAKLKIAATDLQIRAAYADMTCAPINNLYDVMDWATSFGINVILSSHVALDDEYQKANTDAEYVVWWNKVYTGIRDGSIT